MNRSRSNSRSSASGGSGSRRSSRNGRAIDQTGQHSRRSSSASQTSIQQLREAAARQVAAAAAVPRPLSRAPSSSSSSIRSRSSSISSLRNDQIIGLLRHGQSISQVAKDGEGSKILDPVLTPLGVQQAQKVPKQFPKLLSRISRNGVILSSPMRRAFLTMAYAFRQLAEGKIAWELWPELLEARNCNSGTGSTREALTAEFSKVMPWLKFDSLKANWSEKVGLLAAR